MSAVIDTLWKRGYEPSNKVTVYTEGLNSEEMEVELPLSEGVYQILNRSKEIDQFSIETNRGRLYYERYSEPNYWNLCMMKSPDGKEVSEEDRPSDMARIPVNLENKT